MAPTGPHDTDALSSSEPGPPRRRPRRGLVAGLLAVALLAAGATGVALASDTGSSPMPSGSGSSSADEKATPEGSANAKPKDGHRDRFGRRFRHGRPGLGGPLGAPMGGPLHGEFVVPEQGGGYQTLLVQHGTATSVASTSITVKSKDGFSQTYAVTADTVVDSARDGISSIVKGAQVMVLARKAGDQPTALRIGDRARWEGHGLGLARPPTHCVDHAQRVGARPWPPKPALAALILQRAGLPLCMINAEAGVLCA